jgi:MFS transporter, FHS family, L-fucose permease
MTTQTPAVPASWEESLRGGPGFLQGLFETKNGMLTFSDRGASTLASFGFICFLTGRFTGSAILKKAAAHRVLGLYGVLNVVACLLVFLKLGWISVGSVFVSYFLMSIMFPTIFALGIFGLGEQAKKASSFIVMAIFGGAVVPKIMGSVGDHYGMSRAFIVPMACFAVVGAYGYLWPKLSGHEAMHGVSTTGGH